MTQPLSTAFNAAVQTIANKLNPCGYDIDDFPHRVAPSSLRQLNWHIETFGRILVSGEHCASTIYGDAEHNYAFRACHDWTHWHLQAEFTLEGERAVCEEQKRHLHKLGFGAKFDVLVDCEVVGQLEYQARHGEFPRDQLAFTLGYLVGRDAPLFGARPALPWHADFQRGFEIGHDVQFGY